MVKEKILDNINDYSAEQLVEYIQENLITFEDLIKRTNGQLSPNKRRKIKDLIENGDEIAWEKAKSEDTIESYQLYLDTYPNGKSRNDARALKKELEDQLQEKQLLLEVNEAWGKVDKGSKDELIAFKNLYPNSPQAKEASILNDKLLLEEIMIVGVDTLIERINQIQIDKKTGKITLVQEPEKIISEIKYYIDKQYISKEELLGIIKKDKNFLSGGVVKSLVELDIITIGDLIRIGIDKLFIQKMLQGETLKSFSTPDRLDRIHKQSTEIYFWGIPASGKSCAIGAILSAAANGKIAKTMVPDIGSQGYGYMTKLIHQFENKKVVTLLEGTSVDKFYEMGFDLIDKDGMTHPITFIDMAGELMRCMYKSNAGDEVTKLDLEMLETLTNVLIDNRSTSRKMHIFVIEYGAENKLYEGLSQRVYLEGALSYIKNTGIFKKDTDAIYIMITKSDKIKGDKKEAINEYINERYLGFYNGLEQICKDNEINRGRVEKIAFTLGEVCFQYYCRFDSTPASNVVEIILDRSAKYRNGKIGKIGSIFRG